MKKIFTKKYIIYASVFILVCFLFLARKAFLNAAQVSYNKWMVLTMVIDKIQRYYVDEKNPDSLFDNAIQGILAGLDPHSVYLSPEKYKEWVKKYEGYVGIGVKYNILDGKPVVVSVFDDGPADIAGIRVGDNIVTIQGVKTENKKSEQIKDLLLGPVKSSVFIQVKRHNNEGLLEFNVPRENITVSSIPCAFLLDAGTGYIKIDHFSHATPTELDVAVAGLAEQGMKQLMLDLRDNSGGVFSAGIEVADRFLQGGKIIVFTKGRDVKSNEQFISTFEKTLPQFPLVILVNEATASDAEIVAGAIQDWDRGIIAGQQTFGKALVQSEYAFQDGSALLLTTARYYTPLGRLIQREYYNDKSASKNDKLKKAEFITPKGRVLKSNGGIKPDYLLPLADFEMSHSLASLLINDENSIKGFIDKVVESNRIQPDESVADFISRFQVSDSLFNEFINLKENKSSVISAKDLDKNKDFLKFSIKRHVVTRICGEEGRYIFNALNDDQIKKAVKYFNNAQQLLN